MQCWWYFILVKQYYFEEFCFKEEGGQYFVQQQWVGNIVSELGKFVLVGVELIGYD